MIGGSTGSSSSTRELSLVEQKRLQWQKEREEIDRIGSEVFSHSQTNYEKTCIKTYFSNVDLSRSSSHFEEPVARNFQHFPATPQSYSNNGFRPPIPTPAPFDQHTSARAMRSPSLPPIPREKYYNYPTSQTLIINPVHSDTGYHSESSPLNNDGGPIQVWTNDDDGRGSNKTVTIRSRSRPDIDGRPHFQGAHQVQSVNKPLATPNSLSSGQTFSTMSQSIPEAEFREGQQRRKWNDTPQSYFDPMTRSLDSRSSQNVPYWLEKGLHEMRDSEDESIRSSHIRGQNIPIDPNVMAERASRRRKALELQNAIKEQLMEQERLKKWEKEKRIQEEIMAEEKLRKEVEAERQRLEFEKRMQEDKVENERRKAEIMRLAVEKAELEAKLEKERRKKHIKAPEEEVREEEVILKTTPEDVKAPTPAPFRGDAGNLTEPHNVSAQEIFTNKSSEIDGIALVLQSITPIMPLTNLGQPTAQQDLLGLNNSVNNLQFALLLAQQQQQLNMQAQQLNTISSASSMLSNVTSEGPVPNTVRDGGGRRVLESNQPKILESTREDGDEGKECVYCCRIHGGHLRDRALSSATIDAQPEKEAEDKQRNKRFDNPPIIVQEDQPIVSRQDEEIEEEIVPDESMALDVPKIPTDGTFIKEETITLDTDTSTQTDGEVSGFELVTWDKPRVLTPRKYRVSSASSKMLLSTSEVGIQTDLLLLENCNICTHKQLVLKEISQVTTSVTQTSSRKNYDHSPIRRQCVVDEVKGDRELTTTTITTTTTIRAKTNERNTRHNKKEPRPKWGVNQPAFQYVKASDRDPFCLRRRKRGQLKSYSIEEDVTNYRHKADSGVSSNNGSVYSAEMHEDTDKELDAASTRRNICTEILPIKTDGNGQVFVNFREARLVQKDELTTRNVVPAQSHTGREKIMEKRSEDLPFIPSVFRTERKLTKSASVSNYFPSTASAMGSPVSKGDKEELNLLKRNVEI